MKWWISRRASGRLLLKFAEEIDILQLEHDIQDKVRQEVERGHKVNTDPRNS